MGGCGQNGGQTIWCFTGFRQNNEKNEALSISHPVSVQLVFKINIIKVDGFIVLLPYSSMIIFR